MMMIITFPNLHFHKCTSNSPKFSHPRDLVPVQLHVLIVGNWETRFVSGRLVDKPVESWHRWRWFLVVYSESVVIACSFCFLSQVTRRWNIILKWLRQTSAQLQHLSVDNDEGQQNKHHKTSAFCQWFPSERSGTSCCAIWTVIFFITCRALYKLGMCRCNTYIAFN